MKLLIGSLFMLSVSAYADELPSPSVALETGAGISYTRSSALRDSSYNSNYSLLSLNFPGRPWLGARNYSQLFAGYWSGPRETKFVGIARGFGWHSASTFVEVGLGGSYLTDTSYRLKTNTTFHTSLGIGYEWDRFSLIINWRHWSNLNYGAADHSEDFIGLQLRIVGDG